MRNLKRALSLALASVMLLGMMVVGTSAASYPDVKDSDNVEAIEVLNAVGVMIGDRGNFRPDSPVNRHEMAAIMARLIMGEDAENYVGSHPFTDVYPWADKYVAACYENGIINGTSKTTFSGNQPLTAIQAATMMLRALGYEHLTTGASDWRVPVASQANKIGLFRGVTSSPSAQLTRNQVAQLALNTLESDMVEFTGELGWEVNGISIGTQLKWDARRDLNNTNNTGYDYTNDAAGGVTTHQMEYLQLCEDLYDGKLKKDTNDTDDFGRKATTWSYDGDDIITLAVSATRTYTEEVEYGDIYKDLGLSGTKYATLTVDGNETDLNSSSDKDITLTRNSDTKLGGNGVLVQVYKDGDDIDVVVVNTYLAQVSGDYDEDDEELDITAISDITSLGNLDTTLSLDDFANLASFEDDDYVLITAVTDGSDATVKTIVAAETVTANVTGYQKKNNGNPDTVTFDGSAKKYSAHFDANGQSTNYAINEDSVFIMDAYGYVIGLDEVAGSDDYVFIKEFDNKGSFTGSYIADAYFPDGTHQTITLDKVNGNKITGVTEGVPADTKIVAGGNNFSGWYTYTTKNDEYSLTKVDNATDAAGAAIGTSSVKVTENGKVAVVSKASTAGRATNSTVLVMKDGNKVTTYTGIKNFPTITSTDTTTTFSWVSTKDGYVNYMFVDVGEANVKGASSSSSDQIFILATDYKASVDSNENTFYTYDAIVNGTKTTVKDTSNARTVGLYYDVDYDEDGYVDTMTKAADADADYDVKDVSAKAVNHSGGVVTINSSVLVLTDDCVIRVIDGANGKTVTNIRDGEALAKKYDGKAITGTIYVVYNDDDYVTNLYVKVTGTTNTTSATNAKLEATLSYTGTLAWAENDTIQFTGTGLDVTFTYDGSDWTTSDTVTDYDTVTFDGSVLTVEQGTASDVTTNPFGTVTITAKKGGTTAIANVTGTPAWTPGVAVTPTKAKLVLTVTGPVTPTWTNDDTVTVSGASGDLNSTSLVLTKNASGWAITSGQPSGYTAAFNGTKLTLTKDVAGEVASNPWGALTITVSCATDSEAGATAAVTWTAGSDAVG